MSLFTELTRRKVFKVGAAYLVVAWLVVQAASIAFPAFDAPQWALRIFILVALLGFPIALVFAWAFDVTPEGVKADSSSRSSRVILFIAAGFVALAFAWYFKGQPSYRAETGSESVSGAKADTAANVAAARPAGPAPTTAMSAFTIVALMAARLSCRREPASCRHGHRSVHRQHRWTAWRSQVRNRQRPVCR